MNSPASLRFDLHAAGVLAPGVGSLDELLTLARTGCAGEDRAGLPSPKALPANERRRASQVVRLSLACAEQALQARDIGYLNAHGTATPANDRAEAAATRAVFGAGAVPISSTKGVTGHTLGAAGVTEAIVTIQALERQTLPATANLRQVDPRLEIAVVGDSRRAKLRHAMSNSFGFGGTNCSLIFVRAL